MPDALKIELHDEVWSDFYHAYGTAKDIPSLLEKVYFTPGFVGESYKSEPWFTLWSSLCHQGDIYPASAVVVPHLIKAWQQVEEEAVSWQLIALVVAIEESRRERPMQIVDEQLKATQYLDFYSASIAQLPELIVQSASIRGCRMFRKVIKEAKALFGVRIIEQEKKESELGALFALDNNSEEK